MRGSLVHALSGFGAAAWTPASLTAGKALYWSGRTLASVASATNGTGALTGADDTSKVAWLADLSPSGKPLIQATSGSRPIVRASALGRGIAVHGDGAAAVLEAATTLAGVRHCWAAVTFRGDNAVRILGDEPANFVNGYQCYVGGDAIANPSSAILVGNVGTNDLLKTGNIAGTYYRNGSVASDVGRQRLRHVARFTRTADMDAGRVRLGRVPALHRCRHAGAAAEFLLRPEQAVERARHLPHRHLLRLRRRLPEHARQAGRLLRHLRRRVALQLVRQRPPSHALLLHHRQLGAEAREGVTGVAHVQRVVVVGHA